MRDRPMNDRPTAPEQPEYSKPEVEILGDLRDLTEGNTPGTTDAEDNGSA